MQDHLGEVVFVDLPDVGGSVTKATGFGAVESVKATSDINSPVSGEIVEINSKLSETPGLVIIDHPKFLLVYLLLLRSNELFFDLKYIKVLLMLDKNLITTLRCWVFNLKNTSFDLKTFSMTKKMLTFCDN